MIRYAEAAVVGLLIFNCLTRTRTLVLVTSRNFHLFIYIYCTAICAKAACDCLHYRESYDMI